MLLDPKRVVVKVSGEAFATDRASPIDIEAADRIALEIQDAVSARPEIELAVVVGGGNIMRAREIEDPRLMRVTADHAGMLATVINALVLGDLLRSRKIDARVMSAVDMSSVAEPYTIARAGKHLSEKKVVILAGGTGSPYFTTDTAAALRASELAADVILKGTNVDGVFDSDPETNPKAKLFREIDYEDALARRLGVMDLTAFSLCMETMIPIVVFNMNVAGNLKAALSGASVGTLVGRLSTR
jgi:uridylate kinase